MKQGRKEKGQMRDQYGRTIDYIRISITDRCNLRCTYCMPAEGLQVTPHEEILRYEEIGRIVKIAVKTGLRHVKITGGEPLVRQDAAELIGRLKKIPGIETVTLTTNGILLPRYMEDLARAGVDGINISLDTLEEEAYHRITRFGHVKEVLDGLQSALAYPEISVKINSVLEEKHWQENAVALARLAKDYPVHVRFIERMPLSLNEICRDSQEDMVVKVLEEAYGKMTPYENRLGNGPSVYYSLEGFRGKIGFISAVSHKFCDSCNRVRLTSNGHLRMCLQSGKEIDLKTPMREGCGDKKILELLEEGIRNKPREHHFLSENIQSDGMSKIGG